MADNTIRFRQIPEDALRAFEDLFVMGEPLFEQLDGAIDAAPKKVKASAVVAYLAKKVQIPLESLSALIGSLQGLLGAMDSYHVTAAQASKDVVETSLKLSKTEKLIASDSPKYEQRLLSLLSKPQLVLPSKALSLLNDHARVFGNVRIISDVRPVFGEDTSAPPHAWMLYHTLHFRCNLGKEVEDDIFIALDTADLRALEHAVARATSKQKVLISQFKQLKLDYVTPDEVEA